LHRPRVRMPHATRVSVFFAPQTPSLPLFSVFSSESRRFLLKTFQPQRAPDSFLYVFFFFFFLFFLFVIFFFFFFFFSFYSFFQPLNRFRAVPIIFFPHAPFAFRKFVERVLPPQRRPNLPLLLSRDTNSFLLLTLPFQAFNDSQSLPH